MLKTIKGGCLFLILMLVVQFAFSQDGEDQVIKLFRQGDAEGLSEYFQESIDIGLPEKDMDYSREQGRIVLKDFFNEYPVKEFDIEEEGNTNESTRFIIGQYESVKKTFRVLIILKMEDDKYRIHKIKVEED